MKNTALVLAFSLLVGGIARAGSYEMADLKALEKQSAWKELTEHLLDIAPSKRNAEWTAIAEKATSNYLDLITVGKGRAAENALGEVDELLKRLPQMKTSKVFMAKRAELGLKVYAASYQDYRHSSSDDGWLPKLKAFAESDTLTTDLPLRLAKLVTDRLIPVTAFPLVKMAIERQGKSVCKDGVVQKTLVGTVEEGSWAADYTKLVTETCWDDMKAPAIAAIEKADSSKEMLKNMCPLVEKKGALPKNLNEKCHQKAPF